MRARTLIETPDDEWAVCREYEAGSSQKELAAKYRCSTCKIQRLLKRHGVYARLIHKRAKPVYNPSPKEIEQATAKIREGWTPSTEKRRKVQGQQMCLGILVESSRGRRHNGRPIYT